MKYLADIDPLSRLSLLIFRLHYALSAEGDAITAPWGLTSAQWKVLGAIALSEHPLSAAAIGRKMGLSRQAVIRQIALLLDKNMLEKHPNPMDARAPQHNLTAAGWSTFHTINQKWLERIDTFSTPVKVSDIDRTCTLLLRLLMEFEHPPSPATP